MSRCQSIAGCRFEYPTSEISVIDIKEKIMILTGERPGARREIVGFTGEGTFNSPTVVDEGGDDLPLEVPGLSVDLIPRWKLRLGCCSPSVRFALLNAENKFRKDSRSWFDFGSEGRSSFNDCFIPPRLSG